MISWIFTIFADARTTISELGEKIIPLWLAEFLLSLLMQEQLSVASNPALSVVISWIFTIFADARTTANWLASTLDSLWLAEFLLSLLMQEQRLLLHICRICVVISWIFTIFADARTTFKS